MGYEQSEDRAKKEELLKDISEDRPEQAVSEEQPDLVRQARHTMRAAKDNDPNDPWAHRSAGMRCGTCMWFVEKKRELFRTSQRVGRCRRHAPTLFGYPVVFTNDWCGDHKLDEKKA